MAWSDDYFQKSQSEIWGGGGGHILIVVFSRADMGRFAVLADERS